MLSAFNLPSSAKRHKFSFIPHWESEEKYPWRKLCEAADIHYLSPADDPMSTIHAILQSEVVIAEAMHGAVVADTLRVPWIPVRAYSGINEFKWNDWTQSMGMEYKPKTLRSMYQANDFVLKGFKRKYKSNVPDGLVRPLARGFAMLQDAFLTRSTVDQLIKVKGSKTYLSRESLLKSKVTQLLEKLEFVKNKYGNSTADLQSFAA